MNILTIDTALQGCVVGLYNNDDQTIKENIMKMERGQAEHLVPMIQEVTNDFNQIDLIAVTKGPGAFAGLRIGLMSAKTLAMVLNIPVVGVSTFDVIANTVHVLPDIITLETKRSDYYVQVVGQEPQCMSANEIQKFAIDKTIIAGNANERLKSELEEVSNIEFIDIDLTSPQSLAVLALEQFMKAPEKINSDPIYLRSPEIGTPKRPPRKLIHEK